MLKGWKNIPRGSPDLLPVCRIAGRDRNHRPARKISSTHPTGEKKHRFYQDIEAIRALKKLPALTGDSWTQDGITVQYLPPENYARGAWRVTLNLPENYAADVEHPVPGLEYRLFTADPGYSALISAEPDRWDKAFRFVDGVWELHLYTNGVEEDHNPARGCRSGADQRGGRKPAVTDPDLRAQLHHQEDAMKGRQSRYVTGGEVSRECPSPFRGGGEALSEHRS